MWHPKIMALIAALALTFAWPKLCTAQILISEAEAKLPQVQDSSIATRGLTRGPAIELISPAIGTTSVKSPLPLKIKFTARNNIAIDPASVRLVYLKAPLVDLTERVKAYVTKDGLEMNAAEVPSGTHVLRIDLKDAEGRTASTTITLSVAPK